MAQWIKGNIFQVLVSLLLLILTTLFGVVASSIEQKIDTKASKIQVNEMISEKSIAISEIKKDVQYIREALQRIELENKDHLNKIEKKIDCIYKEINN